MKKSMKFLAGAMTAAILSGCSGVAMFDYSYETGGMSKFRAEGMARKTVSVMPFLDQRGTKYFDPMQAGQAAAHPAGDHGSFWLGLLPLIPAGYVEKEEPEFSSDFVTVKRFHFNPKEDLADAAEKSLRESGLFASVLRANSMEQARTDYIWRGIFTNTYYSGCVYSYGITYFLAPVLWILGAPNGTSENELWVKFELVERATGKVIWNYDYRGRDYLVHWLYARNGMDVSMYAWLMCQAMNGALWELSKTPIFN